MLEIGITLLIILFFIFPVPGLAACLGAWTCYLVYRKLHLLASQPRQWKKIVWLYLATGSANLFLSMAIGLLMSLAVYFLIVENLRLLLFNFIFCFFISSRWFDFTHVLYRRLIMKMKQVSLPPSKDAVFAMLSGQRSGSGLGIGMAAVSLDSGFLYWEGNRLVFDGVIGRKEFSPKNILTLEKISFEKIKIVPVRQEADETAEAWVLILRQQFYPFRARELRDQWFQRLSGVQESSGPGLRIEGLESPKIPSA